MHNVASIGILIGALAVATLPARADDQTIGFATGQLGGSARPTQTDIRRVEPLPRASSEAYAGFAQSGGLVQACSYVGGPKGENWTCR
jgi:hypothetical protein